MASTPNNDPWKSLSQSLAKLQQTANAMSSNQFYSGQIIYSNTPPTPHPSGTQFKPGDRVVLISGQHGQDPAPEANPYWGRNDDYIVGTIRQIQQNYSSLSYTIAIDWDNGWMNLYDSDGRSQLTHHSNVPAPAKTGKDAGVQLDTSKLDKLIMEPSAKSEIVALLYQHKHSAKLFNDWGLGETIEYGRGMTMMFYGGPGTGKTWAANCIAKAMHRELLVIGAAEIQTSEPGGANRNIQQAFASARKGNKVLFIDECDSLISNRAQLGMILASEINTLLTEIEKFEGVLILASNRIKDMDPALERRLALIVEFPKPNFEQRLAIWKQLIPTKMPVHADVKFEKLAEHDLTGGFIKNIILQSARLAIAAETESVMPEHFEQAIKRVKASSGLMGKKRVQTGDEVGRTNGDKTVNRDLNRFFGN